MNRFNILKQLKLHKYTINPYKIIFLFILSFFNVNIFAEYIPDAKWINSFGGSSTDCFYSTTETSDGGLIAVGYSMSTDIEGFNNLGYTDAIIIKFDKYGNKIWTNSYGSVKHDKFNSVIETNDKNIVVVGETNSNNLGSTAGRGNAVIIQYDLEGNKIWENNSSYVSNSSSYYNTNSFKSVIEVEDGLISIGHVSKQNSNYVDFLMVKFDKNGKELWSKTFGGSNHDWAFDIKKINNQEFAICGSSYSTSIDNISINNKGNRDAIIAKIDYNGNLIWAQNFGGSYDDYFVSITKIDDGLITVGFTQSTDIEGLDALSTTSYYDAILVKYDVNGNQLWVKNFGSSSDDYFRSVTRMNDGGFVVVGESSSTDIEGFNNLGAYDGIIVKYDNLGNRLWVKNIGGSKNESFQSAVETKDGELVIIGYSNSLDIEELINKGDWDGIIVKYKSQAEMYTEKAESDSTFQNINKARMLVNTIPESTEKDQLQTRLNDLIPYDLTLEPLTSTSNLDVYIASNNSLSLTLSNTSINFEEFDGLSDLTSEPLTLRVNSSLEYNVKTSLEGNIVSSKGNTLNKSIFKIKASTDTDYKDFSNNNELILFSNQSSGNNKEHKINFMLKGNTAHEADVYKAVIKIEINQI